MRTLLKISMAALSVAAACGGDGTSPTSGGTGAAIRVVNGATAAGAVQIYVDGQALAATVSPGQASSKTAVGSGTHTLEIRPASGGTGVLRSVTVADGTTLLVVALDSGGKVTPNVLADTGAIVPPNATKLRVAHMASNAPTIDIWRTQPDYTTPIRVQFPFPYRAESPYLQSTPGDWRVMVSHAIANTGNPLPTMPDTIANSGVISIPAGSSRTVVVVNSPNGGVSIVVVDP